MEDVNKTKDLKSLIKSKRIKVIIFIILCMVINLILMPFAPSGESSHLNGTIATPDEVVNATIKTIFIGFPFLGFILGAIAGLLPYKQLPYSKKYLNFSLVIILVLEIVMLILSIIVLFKHAL